MPVGNGGLSFSQTRPTLPCNSLRPQGINGNLLAKKRCFPTGKMGGFSLCNLGSRGINPLVGILGGLSFHWCPSCAEQGDVQAGVFVWHHSQSTPNPPPLWPPGQSRGIPYPKDTQLTTLSLTKNSEILIKPWLQRQSLECS